MQLAPQVQQLGWRVEPPELEGENKLGNGGPWTFEVQLADTVIPAEVNSAVPTDPIVKVKF